MSKTEQEIVTLGDVIDDHGGLVPVPVAAAMCGVSRQRVDAVCACGRVRVVRIYGYRLVGLDSLKSWRKSCGEWRAA